MLPQIKVYNIDYSFIIKNYLDKSLWNKKWTLFIYKNYVFNICLEYINVKSNKLAFSIECNFIDFNGIKSSKNNTIWHDLGNSNVDVLKRQINGSIIDLIESVEWDFIYYSDEYQKAIELNNEHIRSLRKIASDFLDDNNIDIDEVREAYIDWYVDKNDDYDYRNEIHNQLKNITLFDLYLTFYSVIKQEDKITEIKRKYSAYDLQKCNELTAEIEEKLKYLETDEYREEFEANLECIA